MSLAAPNHSVIFPSSVQPAAPLSTRSSPSNCQDELLDVPARTLSYGQSPHESLHEAVNVHVRGCSGASSRELVEGSFGRALVHPAGATLSNRHSFGRSHPMSPPPVLATVLHESSLACSRFSVASIRCANRVRCARELGQASDDSKILLVEVRRFVVRNNPHRPDRSHTRVKGNQQNFSNRCIQSRRCRERTESDSTINCGPFRSRTVPQGLKVPRERTTQILRKGIRRPPSSEIQSLRCTSSKKAHSRRTCSAKSHRGIDELLQNARGANWSVLQQARPARHFPRQNQVDGRVRCDNSSANRDIFDRCRGSLGDRIHSQNAPKSLSKPQHGKVQLLCLPI